MTKAISGVEAAVGLVHLAEALRVPTLAGEEVPVSEPAVPLDVDGVLLDRAATVADAVHSAQMEGLTVSPATRRDMDAYSAGSIDLAELLRRTRARHGVS